MCPGKMSEKEEQYRKVFRHLDLDGDGRLSPSELRRCAGDIVPESEDEEGMTVEMEEFVRLMMEEEGEEEKEKGLRDAFKMYEDEKRSGRITAKSLKRMLSKLGDKKSVEDCQAMISVFDLDADGVLSFHEFKIMMS